MKKNIIIYILIILLPLIFAILFSYIYQVSYDYTSRTFNFLPKLLGQFSMYFISGLYVTLLAIFTITNKNKYNFKRIYIIAFILMLIICFTPYTVYYREILRFPYFLFIFMGSYASLLVYILLNKNSDS